jgi:hypothetical protein
VLFFVMMLSGLMTGCRADIRLVIFFLRNLSFMLRNTSMCGIVGLFLKRSSLEPELGALFSEMLICMSSRGPDSAGFAVYGDLAPPGKLKVTLQHSDLNFDWSLVAVALEKRFRDKPSVDVNSSHGRRVV